VKRGAIEQKIVWLCHVSWETSEISRRWAGPRLGAFERAASVLKLTSDDSASVVYGMGGLTGL